MFVFSVLHWDFFFHSSLFIFFIPQSLHLHPFLRSSLDLFCRFFNSIGLHFSHELFLSFTRCFFVLPSIAFCSSLDLFLFHSLLYFSFVPRLVIFIHIFYSFSCFQDFTLHSLNTCSQHRQDSRFQAQRRHVPCRLTACSPQFQTHENRLPLVFPP